MWKWILLIFALSFGVFNIQSGDLMMYLTIARDFIVAGDWRQADVHHYIYPQTDDSLIWVHEYLSMLLFYGAWLIGGYAGTVALKCVLLVLLFWTVLKSAPEDRNASPEWMALWALAVFAASFRFIERASLFSDIFTVLLASWCLRERTVTRAFLARLAVLFVLWIQLHPGFVTGFVLLGVWAHWRFAVTRELDLRLAAALLLLPILMLLNPAFLDGLTYPFRFAMNEAQTLKEFNFEWMPAYHPAFILARETIALWILSAAGLFYFYRARAFYSLGFVLSALMFLFALTAVRFVPVAALVIALAVKPYARLKYISFTWAALLLAIAIKNFGWGYVSSAGPRTPGFGLDPQIFPSKTFALLKTLNAGPIYNSQDFGAYLIWENYRPVFHHGFVTDMKFYREEAIGALESPAQFFALAKKYDWKVLLVDRFGGYRQIHRLLAPHPDWKIVAEDEASYLIMHAP